MLTNLFGEALGRVMCSLPEITVPVLKTVFSYVSAIIIRPRPPSSSPRRAVVVGLTPKVAISDVCTERFGNTISSGRGGGRKIRRPLTTQGKGGCLDGLGV